MFVYKFFVQTDHVWKFSKTLNVFDNISCVQFSYSYNAYKNILRSIIFQHYSNLEVVVPVV